MKIVEDRWKNRAKSADESLILEGENPLVNNSAPYNFLIASVKQHFLKFGYF